MVALHHFVESAHPRPSVAEARANVERLQSGLPDTLLARRPEEIRRLARVALDAERAAFRRRAKVGDEPALDDAAADAALDAHAAVEAARGGVRAAANDAMRLLAVGNAWGVICLAGGAALVLRAGFEPMAAPVYGAIVGAAAGPVATTLAGLSVRSLARIKLTSASSAWASAMAATDCATLGELRGRRIARAGWRRRVEEANAATALARESRAAWHRVAGPDVHPRQAPTLLARMTVLRAAQLELLSALLAQRLEPPEPVFEAHPAPTDPQPEMHSSSLIERIRGGLWLWGR